MKPRGQAKWQVNFPHQRFWGVFVAGFLLSLIIFLSGLWAIVSSLNIIAPGVTVGNVSVGGKQFDVARAQVAAAYVTPPDTRVNFTIDKTEFSTPSASLGLKYDTDAAMAQALAVGRSARGFDNVIVVVNSLLFGKHLTVGVHADETATSNWISVFASALELKGTPASVSLITSGVPSSIVVKPGTLQRTVDQESLVHVVLTQHELPVKTIVIPVIERQPLSPIEVNVVKERAVTFVGKSLSFSVDDQQYTLNDKQLIGFLALPTAYNTDAVQKLLLGWRQSVTRDPQEPKIVVEGPRDAPKVTSFTPPLYGRTIDATGSAQLVTDQLQKIETGTVPAVLPQPGDKASPIEIPIARVDPKQKLSDMNSLGINERVGFAESFFHHSIPGRVHNVVLTAQRINYSLIAPGAVFSFNKALGDVSQASGFQQAYIIQAGHTILGDGGGVCQDSTTVFRTVLDAGLPIIERHGHAYRVGYYEQNALPGLDATVFSPSVDLKFKNDTPGYLLLATYPDAANYHLTMELWGTSDGRKSSITDQKVFDQTPARATIYQDDPTLPVGVTKQVDFAAPGAKASFHYTVTRADKTLIDQTFNTTYSPWAAVYLVGTGGR